MLEGLNGIFPYLTSSYCNPICVAFVIIQIITLHTYARARGYVIGAGVHIYIYIQYIYMLFRQKHTFALQPGIAATCTSELTLEPRLITFNQGQSNYVLELSHSFSTPSKSHAHITHHIWSFPVFSMFYSDQSLLSILTPPLTFCQYKYCTFFSSY